MGDKPIPFQQLATGTASKWLTSAFLETLDLKYGHECIA
jgi:hypothetical protein